MTLWKEIGCLGIWFSVWMHTSTLITGHWDLHLKLRCVCLMICLSISFDIAFCNLQLKLVQYPLLMTTIRCWMYIAGGYLLQHLYFVNLMFFSQVYWNECICLWYRCNFFYSDITALAKDRAYTHINLDEMTIHQVPCFPIPFNLIFNTCYQVVGFLFIMITFLFCPSCRDLFLVSSLSLSLLEKFF